MASARYTYQWGPGTRLEKIQEFEKIIFEEEETVCPETD